VQTATQELLNSKPWWEASTSRSRTTRPKPKRAKKALEPYAATIQVLRDQIRARSRAWASAMAAGLLSEEQYARGAGDIQSHRDGLVKVTNAYNDVSQAMIDQAAQGMTATSQHRDPPASRDGSGRPGQSHRQRYRGAGQEDREDLRRMARTAVQAYATTYSEFASGCRARRRACREDRSARKGQEAEGDHAEQKQGHRRPDQAGQQAYADQEQSAALSYARQQEAQKQHLGQMLIDYTVAGQLGNISKEKAAEITAGWRKSTGCRSPAPRPHSCIWPAIDKFAKDAGGDIDDLITDLRDQGQQAKDTQKKMDDYAKEYVATQTNNFVAGKQDADDYIESLEKIPKEVNTTVTTTYREQARQSRRRSQPAVARARERRPRRCRDGPTWSARKGRRLWCQIAMRPC
jgi:hypothetical protein